MKLALVNGEKVEATRGAKGKCDFCGSELIAKCGELKVNHWAHKGNRYCDPWWENETEWHRSWKNKFPKSWQEVVQFDASGEKHIADIRTESGLVLEFQHSYLKPEERRSRGRFYPNLIWVIDGTRRKTDTAQFQEIYKEGASISEELLVKRVHFPEECRLLREWLDINGLVFLDFQHSLGSGLSEFYFLLPKTATGEVYISPFSREAFIQLHNENKFYEEIKKMFLFINNELNRRKLSEQRKNLRSNSNLLPGFERYLVRRRRQRRF